MNQLKILWCLGKPVVFDLKILKCILSKSIMLSTPHTQKAILNSALKINVYTSFLLTLIFSFRNMLNWFVSLLKLSA